MFTFEEGLKIVFEYFGINGKPEVEMPEPQTEHIEKAEISKKDKKIDFDIKLEDFIS